MAFGISSCRRSAGSSDRRWLPLSVVGPVEDVVLGQGRVVRVRDAHHGVPDAVPATSSPPMKVRNVPVTSFQDWHPAPGSRLARARVVDETLLYRPRGPRSSRAVRTAAAAAGPCGVGASAPTAAAASRSRAGPRRGRCTGAPPHPPTHRSRRGTVAPRGAARRPEDGPVWPRRAAARPPPCGCDGLRRCSLIERLLLGQAHPCVLETAAGFRTPEVRMRSFAHSPVLHQDEDALRRHSVPGGFAWRTDYAPSKPP